MGLVAQVGTCKLPGRGPPSRAAGRSALAQYRKMAALVHSPCIFRRHIAVRRALRLARVRRPRRLFVVYFGPTPVPHDGASRPGMCRRSDVGLRDLSISVPVAIVTLLFLLKKRIFPTRLGPHFAPSPAGLSKYQSRSSSSDGSRAGDRRMGVPAGARQPASQLRAKYLRLLGADQAGSKFPELCSPPSRAFIWHFHRAWGFPDLAHYSHSAGHIARCQRHRHSEPVHRTPDDAQMRERPGGLWLRPDSILVTPSGSGLHCRWRERRTWLAVNLLASLLAFSTLLSYLFLYTPLKRTTPLCTLIGAFPGAVPPLIGWAAARGRLDAEAWALYALAFLWQFPHFMAIAWMYRDDYARAGYLFLPPGKRRDRSVNWQSAAAPTLPFRSAYFQRSPASCVPSFGLALF